MNKLLVGNWKMNPRRLAEARVLASRIDHGLTNLDRGQLETVIAPPFVFLSAVKHSIHFVKLGVQDFFHEEKEGAFTSQVSIGQIEDFGTTYAILGHSERRAMGEKDKQINAKIKIALKHKMHPILCVGHGVGKKASPSVIKRKIGSQISAGLKGVKFRNSDLTIAYEPVWAIGTGRAVDPEHSLEISEFAKSKIGDVRVIYGGSMNAENASGFAVAGIEGGLIGGASLDAAQFLAIARAFADSPSSQQ